MNAHFAKIHATTSGNYTTEYHYFAEVCWGKYKFYHRQYLRPAPINVPIDVENHFIAQNQISSLLSKIPAKGRLWSFGLAMFQRQLRQPEICSVFYEKSLDKYTISFSISNH
jgi:hypothetical protein